MMYLTNIYRVSLAALLFILFNTSLSNAQVLSNGKVEIIADKVSGCAPEAVKFTLENAGTPTNLTWIIGKDTIKDAKTTQTYLFANAGIYTVSALYKTATGNDTIVVNANFVKLGSGTKPVTLKASRNYLCNGPDTISFSAYAAGAASYDWIIDGTNYPNAGTSLVHKFQTAGVKNITIRIKDSLGCYGLQTFNNVVTIATPPKVDFDANIKDGCLPLQVNFSQKIVKGSADIASYKWEFTSAQQSLSTSQNPVKITYNKAGKYNVTLTIVTKDGCTFSITKNDFITVGDTLTPRFKASKTNICKSDIITYTSLSKSEGLVWNFPGGTVLANSTDSLKYVQYDSFGTYSASAKYASGACNKTFTLQKAAVIEQLKAEFTADKFCSCRVADTIVFKNTSTVPTNGKASYSWTFYDADGKTILGTSTQANPSRIYAKYGNYNVKLVVKHSNGCADSILKENFLAFAPLQVGSFNINPIAACSNKSINLKLKVTACESAKYNYLWIIYKAGTTEEVNRLTGQNPKVILYTLGSYDVKVIVTSSEGCSVEKFMKNLVNVITPTPDFTADNTAACMEEGITLIQKTTPDSFSYAHSWTLTLASDSTVRIKGSGATFNPEFTRPGVYSVKYTVSLAGGCSYTITKKNYLNISGIRADFSVSKQDGCLPFTSTLKSQILENVHFDNNDSVKYEWIASPANYATFENAHAAETKITLTKTGYYTITLKITNSKGCTQTITKKNLLWAGIVAAYNMPVKNCFGEAITVTNQSSRNATEFKWSSTNAGVTFSPSASAKNPIITFAKGGTYTIKLVSKSDEGCSDSISKNITIEQVKSQFSSKDTLNTCAPAYVSFTAKGTGIDSFIWYFGDGEMLRTKDTNIAHIYKYNSGDMSTGFDVMLIVKGKSGCTDTLLRKKYIKVLGPIPSFAASNMQGCEPLQVNFTNNSKYTKKFYLDYGDFSQPDTTNFAPHIYTVKDANAAYEVYKPRLLAKDEFGCSVWAYVTDSIVVYKAPSANFTVANKQVCAGEAVEFNNTSNYAVKYIWDFNSDGKVDDTTRNPKVFLNAGTYAVTLTVANAMGCTDLLFLKNVVNVNPKPEATITASADTICAGSNVSFQLTAKDEIKSYKWFVNNTLVENNDSSVLTKAFFAPGIYAVSAEITTVNGCTNTIQLNKTVFVPDTAAPIAPALTYVTVEKDTFVKISWNRNNDKSFGKYNLYKQNGNAYQLIFSTSDRNETQFSDVKTSVHNQNYTYRLVVENYCGNGSQPSVAHTTVLLKVKAEATNTLQLNWTKYKGWNVQEYAIYRAAGGSFEYLNKVSGNDTTYSDKGLCNQLYAYYVVAKNASGNYTSLSNTATAKPNYQYRTTSEDVRFATVTDDDKINIQWQKSDDNDNPKAYIIDRFEAGKGWTENYASINELQFTDTKVKVNEKSYAYRIRIEDHCGNITTAGEIGKTILLTAEALDEKVQLKWSAYGRWKNGIRQYRVEILNAQQQWQLVTTVNGNDTSYMDANDHSNIKGGLIYRVIAEENANTDAVSSTSNKAEVFLTSHLYVPNAFTPDADGINDVFKAEGKFINEDAGSEDHNFKLCIFNRWGEKVFETNSIDKGWDGKFKGADAQQDTYIYTIIAFGYDMQSYYLQGNFTLLR